LFFFQHDNVRELFSRYKSTTEFEEKKRIASTLVREMAIHSDSEEISVYNLMLKKGFVAEIEQDKSPSRSQTYLLLISRIDDSFFWSRGTEEHAEVKRLVYDADTTHMKTADDYDAVLAKAVNAFIEHATEEENDQLPRLVAALSQEENTVSPALLQARRVERELNRPPLFFCFPLCQNAAREFLKVSHPLLLLSHTLLSTSTSPC
jgi:hypothetical protein